MAWLFRSEVAMLRSGRVFAATPHEPLKSSFGVVGHRTAFRSPGTRVMTHASICGAPGGKGRSEMEPRHPDWPAVPRAAATPSAQPAVRWSHSTLAKLVVLLVIGAGLLLAGPALAGGLGQMGTALLPRTFWVS